MNKLVTIYGGSGFVGRYITQRMARLGWRVRVACRRPNEALFVRTYGVPGQVEPIFCNVRDDQSVAQAMQGAEAVINCVGILNALGRNNFDAVQAQAPARIARIAASQGVASLVHISAMGADQNSASAYSRSKALGEEAVSAVFPTAVILRPSVIFGSEDQFFNRFAAMARTIPLFLPLVGGQTKFQPVYVGDVAAAAVVAVTQQVTPGIYELGGPEVASFRALMVKMLGVIRRRRMIIGLPFFVAGVMALALDSVQAITLGLIENKILTRDQLKNLKHDAIVSAGAKGLVDLGIVPTAMEPVLDEYLWRYRPSGQYAAIKESADGLNS